MSKGEVVVVIGPSGCGKSTLLRRVAALEGVQSGDALSAVETPLPSKDGRQFLLPAIL